MLDDIAADDLWIFAYGSLMWRPGFAFVQAVPARLAGHHRGFCIYSVVHRGTLKRPGLVLGLDRGGVCEGIAYRIASAAAHQTLAAVRAREQVTSVYREAWLPIEVDRARRWSVLAVTYLAERRHPAYAGDLPLCRQAALIQGAAGRSGGNVDYLLRTVSHLRQLGIRERRLERLAGLVRGVEPLTWGDREFRDGGFEGMRRSHARRHLSVPKFKRSDLGRFSFRAGLTGPGGWF